MKKTLHSKKGPQKISKNFIYKTMRSPIGVLKLVASDEGLAGILWEKEDGTRVRLGNMIEDAQSPVLREAEKQLNEYFSGKRQTFDLKLDFNGTPFQKKVWKALLNIPFGTTMSYADVARKLGMPKSSRAVGGANHRNPISIVAACHRVISSRGDLVGYAGGMKAKEFLLMHEGASFNNK